MGTTQNAKNGLKRFPPSRSILGFVKHHYKSSLVNQQ